MAEEEIPTGEQDFLISEPKKYATYISNISRWLAAFNPIVFGYQRKDFGVTKIEEALNPDLIKVTLAEAPTTDEKALLISKGFYLKTDLYEFTLTSLTSDAFNGLGGSAFIFDKSSIALVGDEINIQGGFLIGHGLKKNYRVQTTITSGSNPAYKDNLNAVHSPNTKGYTRADLSSYLQNLLSPINTFEFDVVNFKDVNMAASFTITYQAVWDNDNSPLFEILEPYYVVYSAMQLQEKGGGNLAEYVPFGVNSEAKFLNKFPNPIKYIGLPFALNFLYSEAILEHDIYAEQIGYNSRGEVVYTTFNHLLNNDIDNTLIGETDKLLISSSAIGNIDIIEDLGYNHLLISDSLDEEVVALTIQLFYYSDPENPNSVKVYIGELKTLLVEHPCETPYVYLKWVNQISGWDFFRFGINQIHGASTANEITASRFVLDWEAGDTIGDVLKKSAVNKIELGKESLTSNEISGLDSLRKSIKVQMLSQENPIKWQTVIVKPSSYDTQRGGKGGIRLTIDLPETNIQTQ